MSTFNYDIATAQPKTTPKLVRNKLTASTSSLGEDFTPEGPKQLHKFLCDGARCPRGQDDHIASASDEAEALK